MVVRATDPVTGLAIGAPGTTGSGRQSGQATKKGPPRKMGQYDAQGNPLAADSPLRARGASHFSDPTRFTRPIDSSTFMNRSTDARSGFGSFGDTLGGDTTTSIYDTQGSGTGINALGTDPITGIPNFVQPGYAAPEYPTNIPSYDDQDRAPGVFARNSFEQIVNVETGEIGTEADLAAQNGAGLSEDELSFVDGEGGDAGASLGGSPDSVFSALSEFGIKDTIDSSALQRWHSDLLESGLYITEVREMPPGSGNFIAFDENGGTHASPNVLMGSDVVLESEIQIKRVELEEGRLALDTETQGEQLRIQEEMGRIDQDIARDRIQHEQEVASGNWQNALDVQDRIDERERSSRQLERDLFNANQELQNRKFELERASFDLDKLEFFQQLSSSPANFADLFNISRGLAPTGAGGPMPQGVARIGQSNVQQTAAQDFRMNGINMAPNINTGALPTLGAEQAVPQFNPAQTQLSFMNGQDPTPVDATGQPVAPAAAPAQLNTEPSGETDAYAETGSGIVQDQASNPVQPNAMGSQLPAPLDFNATTDESGVNISAPVNSPVNGSQVDGLQTISNPSVAAVAQTAEEVVQGAPLPPGIEMAFRNALVGAPQTAQDSIPLLSPQVLNSLTPAEQQVYFGLAQMQGQYLPDFENLLASRGGSQQVQDSQRVFV